MKNKGILALCKSVRQIFTLSTHIPQPTSPDPQANFLRPFKTTTTASAGRSTYFSSLNSLSPNNKTKTSSSSAQAAESKQENMTTIGRTTRGMKAKAQKAAAEEQANANAAEDVTSNTMNTSKSSDKAASKSISNPREQASGTAKGKQASGNAHNTAHKTQPTSATTKSCTTSVLGKRKSSSSEDSSPQQNDNSNKAPRESVLTGKSNKDSDEEKEIDPTSHLITQYFSNGKVRVNSNGKPEKLQRHIHSEVDEWIKSELKKPFHWGTQIESVSSANMLDDFKDMGFSAATTGDMMKLKEPLRVDGTMQRPSAGYGNHVEGTGEDLEKRTRKPSTRGKKYEALVIFEDQGKSAAVFLHLFACNFY